MGVRISTGLVRITAVGGGDGVAIGVTGFVLLTLATQRAATRAIIRSLRWRNISGGNGSLLIGYGDLTAAGSVFRQVWAEWMVNLLPDGLAEGELPILGNMVQGFQADRTLITGSLGDIIVETDCAGCAVATPFGVIAEIELF